LRESFDFFGPETEYFTVESVPEFHKAILAMEAETRLQVIPIILKLLGISLQLKNPHYFLHCCNWLNGEWETNVPSYKTFRTLFYPKVPPDMEITDKHFRVKEHSDFGYEFFFLPYQQ